jgi:hypothetical protein
MSETPIESLTPEQATAKLNEMAAAFHGTPPGTAAQAAAELEALMANREWAGRYMEGGTAERAKFAELTTRIAAGDTVADMAAGKVEPPSIEVTTGDQLPTHTMMQAIADLQARGLTDEAVAEILTGKTFSREEVRAAEQWRERAVRDPLFRAALLTGDSNCGRQWLVANAIIAMGAGEA